MCFSCLQRPHPVRGFFLPSLHPSSEGSSFPGSPPIPMGMGHLARRMVEMEGRGEVGHGRIRGGGRACFDATPAKGCVIGDSCCHPIWGYFSPPHTAGGPDPAPIRLLVYFNFDHYGPIIGPGSVYSCFDTPIPRPRASVPLSQHARTRLGRARFHISGGSLDRLTLDLHFSSSILSGLDIFICNPRCIVQAHTSASRVPPTKGIHIRFGYIPSLPLCLPPLLIFSSWIPCFIIFIL